LTIYDSEKIHKDIGGMLSSLLYVKDRHGVMNNPHVASFIDTAHNVSTALNVNDDLVESNDEVFVRAMNVLSDLKRLKDLLDSLKGIKVTNFPPRYQAQIKSITDNLGAAWESRTTSTLDYIREYTTNSDFMTLKDALKRASLNTSLISPKDYLKQEPEKADEAVPDGLAVQANNKAGESGGRSDAHQEPTDDDGGHQEATDGKGRSETRAPQNEEDQGPDRGAQGDPSGEKPVSDLYQEKIAEQGNEQVAREQEFENALSDLEGMFAPDLSETVLNGDE
jgi:hypothetical protein